MAEPISICLHREIQILVAMLRVVTHLWPVSGHFRFRTLVAGEKNDRGAVAEHSHAGAWERGERPLYSLPEVSLSNCTSEQLTVFDRPKFARI